MDSWRFFRTFGIATMTFLVLHCAAWLWSANRLAVLIDQQADRLRSQGWRIEIASARYGGWPGQVRGEIGPATFAARGVSVRAESLVANTALVRPGPLTWQSRGHAVRFGSGAERPVLAGDVAGEASSDGVVLTTASTHVAELIAAEALRMWIKPNETIITVQRLRPLDARWAPGPIIEALELRVEARSPTSSVAGSQSSELPLQAASDHFDIKMMNLAVGGMDATGHAELWFDAALRLRLDGVVHVAGYAAGLDGLVAAGVISSRAAIAAKAVLGLLATPPGGAAEIPVRIEGGILYAAQFALIRLPTLGESNLGLLR